MITFVKSSLNMINIEMDIINSNKYFNLLSKGKEELTIEEITKEINQSIEIGAERYLIKDEDEYVGIIEFLMRNPNDGYPWLGLLVIKKELQHKGYGDQSLKEFYKFMQARNIRTFRIGVIIDNEAAHKFWRKHGFRELSKTSTTIGDKKEVIMYEKNMMNEDQ